MSKHTAGPWAFINGGALVQDTGNRLHIGTFSESCGLGNAAAANARLIAAAPELLDACEHAIGVLLEADADGVFTIAQAQSIIFRARAAIAKAKGE